MRMKAVAVAEIALEAMIFLPIFTLFVASSVTVARALARNAASEANFATAYAGMQIALESAYLPGMNASSLRNIVLAETHDNGAVYDASSGSMQCSAGYICRLACVNNTLVEVVERYESPN